MVTMEFGGLYAIRLTEEQLKYLIEVVKQDTKTKRMISGAHRLCDIEDIPSKDLLEIEKSCLLGEELLFSWINMKDYDI